MTKQWEATGLLEGLKKADKAICANRLSEAVNYLIEVDATEEISGCMIPAIRRIYSIDKNKKVDLPVLHKMLEHGIKTMKDVTTYHDIDWEAEVLDMVCKHYVRN